MALDDYLRLNHANWEERVPAHVASPDYAVDRFRDDPAYLSDVVRFDLPRMGSVEGLRGVHLQCHIGTDTVSLGRLGARVTGLDLSAPAIDQARAFAAAAGVEATFVRAELYEAVEALGRERFDLVVCHSVLQYLDDAAAERAIDNIGHMCRGLLYLEVVTKGDLPILDLEKSDTRMDLRTGRWYRTRLGRHFFQVGAGLWASRRSPVQLFELEAPTADTGRD